MGIPKSYGRGIVSAAIIAVAIIGYSPISMAQKINTIILSDEPLLAEDTTAGLNGLFVNFFKLVSQEVEREVEISRLPWRRAQKEVTQSIAMALGPITRTPKREKMFSWIAPMFQMRSVYVSKADQSRVHDIEHARTLRIGLKIGSAVGFAAAKHKIPVKSLYEASSNQNLLRMLDQDRIDAFLSWDVIALRTLRKFPTTFKINFGYSDLLGDLYFAGSPNLNSDEIELWKKAVLKVIQRGELGALMISHLGVNLLEPNS